MKYQQPETSSTSPTAPATPATVTPAILFAGQSITLTLKVQFSQQLSFLNTEGSSFISVALHTPSPSIFSSLKDSHGPVYRHTQSKVITRFRTSSHHWVECKIIINLRDRMEPTSRNLPAWVFWWWFCIYKLTYVVETNFCGYFVVVELLCMWSFLTVSSINERNFFYSKLFLHLVVEDVKGHNSQELIAGPKNC